MVAFEARLIPHRSTWDVVRTTWTPFLAAFSLVVVAKALERVSEPASNVIAVLSGPAFIIGLLALTMGWRRGPMLRVAEGELSIGPLRAHVAEIRTEPGVFVFRSRYGTFMSPTLTLHLPAGESVAIGCEGGGGPAHGQKPTPAPRYLLPAAQWDALARHLST